MIEGPNRTNRTFALLRSKNVRGKQMVRVIVTVVVTLALLALSKYEFHADLRLDQIVFVALGWVLAVVIGRSHDEKVVAQVPLARSRRAFAAIPENGSSRSPRGRSGPRFQQLARRDYRL